MMKIQKSRVKVIFIIAISIILVLSLFSYIRIKHLLEASGSINQSNLVKLELDNIFSNLKDTESDQRGFMLTKDVIFVQNTQKAEKNIIKHLKTFDSLSVDNPIQQNNLKLLRKMIDKKLENQKIIFTEALTDEVANIRWERGRMIMNDVRRQIDNMLAIENSLLDRRTESLSETSSPTPAIFIVLIILSVIGVVTSYLQVLKELKFTKSLKTILESREKELVNANLSLAEKNNSLAEINKELESFTYISSHDLQEPLRKIQTFIGRIYEKELGNFSENGKLFLDRILVSANRMQTLIQDLLAYSKTKTEGFVIEETDLNSILEEVKSDLKEDIDEKNVVIISKNLCSVKINISQFRQLLINLISNAIKFSTPDISPIITIKTQVVIAKDVSPDLLTTNEKYCHISISDNGIGFQQEYENKIFQVFQRLYSRDEFKVTGIGLAIVKKIVENHNGFINAEGKLGKGATFNIYIPC